MNTNNQAGYPMRNEPQLGAEQTPGDAMPTIDPNLLSPPETQQV